MKIPKEMLVQLIMLSRKNQFTPEELRRMNDYALVNTYMIYVQKEDIVII